jgi:hypothetical protein
VSIAAAIHDLLTSNTAVAAIVSDRVAPYARNRDDGFPAITYSVPTEEPAQHATTGSGYRTAQVAIACMARTYDDADELAEAVLAAVVPGDTDGACIGSVRWLSHERDFLDAFDGSTTLIYRTTVNLTITTTGA